MRKAPNERIESFRIAGPLDTNYGACILRFHGQALRVIFSCGGGWDHVSVSRDDRCPTWAEMCFVKSRFFYPNEAAMQLHPPESAHVNNHQYCLHIWRPQSQEEMDAIRAEYQAVEDAWPWDEKSPGEIPLPPEIMVGIKALGTIA